MTKETSYLTEMELIQQAERARSQAIGEFFARLFERHKGEDHPLNPIPAE